ncbi:MAG: hypothetical protein NTV30_00570 [Chloroflexi bacterium]|nr:hypothetical protein [Chloroflexota bacterium]
MSEFVINIPKNLEEDLKELPELENSVKEFLRLKAFEKELKRSLELQRFVFEALASKSRLTGRNASELADKIDKGLLEELREDKLL